MTGHIGVKNSSPGSSGAATPENMDSGSLNSNRGKEAVSKSDKEEEVELEQFGRDESDENTRRKRFLVTVEQPTRIVRRVREQEDETKGD